MQRAHRIALSVLYSSPILSRFPPRLLCRLSARKALTANSSSVMSVVSCSFPLSPSGFAIEAWSTKILITYLTMSGILLRASIVCVSSFSFPESRVPYHNRANSGEKLPRMLVLTKFNLSTASFMYRLEPAIPGEGSITFCRSTL